MDARGAHRGSIVRAADRPTTAGRPARARCTVTRRSLRRRRPSRPQVGFRQPRTRTTPDVVLVRELARRAVVEVPRGCEHHRWSTGCHGGTGGRRPRPSEGGRDRPSPATSVAVLIVDDQPPFRAAARAVVDAAPGFTVVGDAESGEEAVAAVGRWRPDLVLMDINLPGISGIEATRRILATGGSTAGRRCCPPTPADLPADARTCGAPPRTCTRGTSPSTSSGSSGHRHPDRVRVPADVAQAPRTLRAACARWRRMRRRSRSDSPPQMPNFSPFCSANSGTPRARRSPGRPPWPRGSTRRARGRRGRDRHRGSWRGPANRGPRDRGAE